MGALSNGCALCKKKKVKCDETHPKCIRCCKASIDCPGFAPRLRFVNETPRIRHSVAVSHAQIRDYSVKARNHPSQLMHRGHIRSSLPQPLSLAAFKDDILISFLVLKLFKRQNGTQSDVAGETQCGLPLAWMPELKHTSLRRRHKSWDALAAMYFGQAHNSCAVIANAYELYGQALVQLHNQLTEPYGWRSDDIMASMTALCRYETIVSSSGRSWMRHAEGLAWLLERRGPWEHKPYAGKAIFLEHRVMLIAKAIISGERTFLHTQIWKTVPWEDSLACKPAIEYLVDIGTDIAEHVARFKKHDLHGFQEGGYSTIIDEVASSIEDLNTWWHQWEGKHATSATEIPLDPTSSQPFSSLLEYDNVWITFELCTYNTMRILLLQLWTSLMPSPTSVQLDKPNPTAFLGISSDTQGLAREIMRSLEYCYRQSQLFVNMVSFSFIQDVAYGCFEEHSAEAKWIAEHRWAKPQVGDLEEANLLEKLSPLSRISIEQAR